MTTPLNLSEEIKTYIREHDLVPPAAFADEPQAGLQLALTRVADLVASSFGELAEQASGREVLWNAARESAGAAAGPTPPAGRNAATLVPQRGAGLVKATLDDRYHGTMHAIAKAADVQPATTTALLDVATTAALEVLERQVTTHNWNAQELGQWLRSQSVVAAPPAGASGIPDTQLAKLHLAAITATATPHAAPSAPLANNEGVGSWLSRRSNVLLVGVSLIALAEFGYIIGTRSDNTSPEATASAAPAAGPDAKTETSARQYAAIPVANLSALAGTARAKAAVPVVLKLKNGLRQIIGANSTESKLYQFLVDPSREVDPVDPTKGWIGFDRIYFETNKAVLTNESLWQLSNVSLILKRFPAAKVKIGGYTDSSGKPLVNLRLSQERAKAAMATLVGLGVPADHLTAVGYGAIDNIAPNETEEGRALNRRVSLQVVQK